MYEENPIWIIRTDYNWDEHDRESYDKGRLPGLEISSAMHGLPSDGFKLFTKRPGKDSPIIEELERKIRSFTKRDIFPCIDLTQMNEIGRPTVGLHFPYSTFSIQDSGDITAEILREYIMLKGERFASSFIKNKLPSGTTSVRVIIDYVSNTGFFRPIFYQLNEDFDVIRIDAMQKGRAELNLGWES